ncbi:MAG: tetratricopeptide repeat protein [Planctomycetes bacterium]|nr:tetratricopeptide repeat protein [Planctomycetota bacterium]
MIRSHGWLRAAGLTLATLAMVTATAAGAESPRPADLRSQFTQALNQFDQAQEIQSQQPDRARQLLLSAAQRFKSLVAAGITNGRLEYNLGNCYLQARDPGRAILHYRRALRLIPRDPLLTDNLHEARSRCLTQIRSARSKAFLRSVFFWHYQTSMAERTWVAWVGYVAFWLLLAMRSLWPRRVLFIMATVAGALALVMAGSVAVTQGSQRNTPAGVVTALDVIVYKGPGSGYQRQFEQPLQPGVEFIVRERRGSWWRAELPDGQLGWIAASDAELVTPDSS